MIAGKSSLMFFSALAVCIYGVFSQTVTCKWNRSRLIDGKCFLVLEVNLSWKEALQVCRNFGATLATLSTQNQFDNATTLFNNYGSLWIGASDKAREGIFVWVGDHSQFTSNSWWQPDHPLTNANSNCVAVGAGSVADDRCENLYNALCMEPQNTAVLRMASLLLISLLPAVTSLLLQMMVS
ncbi:lectin BRA-3-like [Physella acuta]|uniref:lectin BRA-3-like n=1 Tax=Physella acuta TaxID=109671 RepID=UPI0027DAFE7F|nr:lectin BRA-3-like [Physella acuta]